MAKLVTLATKLLGMEEKELYELFTKRMDIASNIWLFVVGFIVGYVSTFASIVLNIASVASSVWGVFPVYSLLLAVTVVLALYIFGWVVYHGFYGINPIHAQESVLKDYLAARKIIRDRQADWATFAIDIF